MIALFYASLAMPVAHEAAALVSSTRVQSKHADCGSWSVNPPDFENVCSSIRTRHMYISLPLFTTRAHAYILPTSRRA